MMDCSIAAMRRQAICNRGKQVTYKQFVSENTNLKTGDTTPTFTSHPKKALISGLKREEDGMSRTFRFMSEDLPEFPPSMRSVLTYGGRTYNIVGWETSQHEDVVDIKGASP